ncbi:MAG: DUF3592 domain-containing protein [Pararhodobacter sp.]
MERRRITFRRLFTRHFIWVPLLPLALAIGLSLFALHELRKADRLDLHGAEAVARVIARDIRTSRDNDGRTQTEYRVEYRFQPSSGDAVTTRRSVNRATYNAMAPGDEILVRYVLHDPLTNEIEPGQSRRTGRILLAIAVPFALCALVALVWIGRRKAQLFRAVWFGEVRQARVTEHEALNVQVNGRTRYRLHWLDALGQTGRSGMHDHDDLAAKGEVIVVYVDPRSGKGWWDADI